MGGEVKSGADMEGNPSNNFKKLHRRIKQDFKVSTNKDIISLERLKAANLVIFAGPREMFSSDEFTAIKDYLSEGGSILFLVGEGGEGKSNTNVNYLLEEFGMSGVASVLPCLALLCRTRSANSAWQHIKFIKAGFKVPNDRTIVDVSGFARHEHQHFFNETDLQIAFPDPFGKDSAELRRWFQYDGLPQIEISLVPHFLAKRQQMSQFKIRKDELPFGVNVYGWLNGVFGVGEASRLTLRALEVAEIPSTAILLPTTGMHNQVKLVQTTRIPRYSVNLFVANAINTDEVTRVYPTGEWRRHHNIGYWAWELERFPSSWLRYLQRYDEVWTVSDFVTQSILSSPDYDRTTPVTTMPMGLDMNLTNYRENRQRFNFPGGTTVFLVMFDFLSSFHRKNPLAALAAFRSAFEAQEGSPKVLLVIKCLLPKGAFAFEQEFALLEHMVSKARNVRIMTEVLSKEDLNTLMASVDVLVSLHRSEGYGLVLLEMLMLGKPVIATGYSGNMQFMSKLPIEFQFLQIPYAYIPVNVSEHFQKVYTSDQRWADPDVEAAAKAMYKLYSDPALLQRSAADSRETLHSLAIE
eukprot:g9253.t2